uniref:E3 ubiquitin-protein ligase MARCH8-like isoform X1 n=1 Tax=Populus alba TaxID=43335 RepID=A0A4U5R0T4_POPAL|nr:E3 ubiquitin-protein ligase MARCH8-like isoform X1 [Populus alba]
MQLVSNDSCKEDISESEPILSHSNISQHSEEESPSSLEIKSLGGDCEIHVDDLESIQIDETCHLVNPDQPQCRICLDNEGEDLIAPCHCKGTQKYVHRSCLDNWRSTKEGFAFAHCTECRAMFVLRANVPADRWWLRLKFQFLWSLVLNVSAAMEIEIFVNQEDVNCCILGCAGVQVLWGGLRESLRYGEHPYGFYTMAVLAIVLVGLLYGFFIAIICGQRINERHYHVLAKQELTKEYVVEDREASKDVPELGASHVSELRMLGLY